MSQLDIQKQWNYYTKFTQLIMSRLELTDEIAKENEERRERVKESLDNGIVKR